MFCFKVGKKLGKRFRVMPGGQRQAPKKPWELRYVLLSNTMLRWTQPVSVYLLERIGSSGKVWLVCRPALDPEQETEPRFQLPGAPEDEYICFEQVDFIQHAAGGGRLPSGPAGADAGRDHVRPHLSSRGEPVHAGEPAGGVPDQPRHRAHVHKVSLALPKQSDQSRRATLACLQMLDTFVRVLCQAERGPAEPEAKAGGPQAGDSRL